MRVRIAVGVVVGHGGGLSARNIFVSLRAGGATPRRCTSHPARAEARSRAHRRTAMRTAHAPDHATRLGLRTTPLRSEHPCERALPGGGGQCRAACS